MVVICKRQSCDRYRRIVGARGFDRRDSRCRSVQLGRDAEQRRACTPDVYRLCAAEIPSVSGITACLRRKKASLSDACRAVFEQ